jgi:hypothetical protein
MMNRDNKRRKQYQTEQYDRKKQRHQRTPQEQDEWEKQREEGDRKQRLQDFTFRHSYDSDFKHVDEYYQGASSMEQKQVEEREKMEQSEIAQLDDDYVERFKLIELLEEEETKEEQHYYNEMQNQLEQLEHEEMLQQREHIEYGYWLEHSQQQQQPYQEVR